MGGECGLEDILFSEGFDEFEISLVASALKVQVSLIVVATSRSASVHYFAQGLTRTFRSAQERSSSAKDPLHR